MLPGHVAGTWGSTAGLKVETWNDKDLVLTGDAYMRAEDTRVVSEAVQASLEQFCSAILTETIDTSVPTEGPEISPDTFNICTNNNMPKMEFDPELLHEVLTGTPKAGLSEGLGQLERFRTELGPFIGVSSSLETSSLNGGFGPEQNEKALIGSIEANLIMGLGLDGVMNKAGDGLAFLQLGWRQDSPTTSQFTDLNSTYQGSSVTSPFREGLPTTCVCACHSGSYLAI